MRKKTLATFSDNGILNFNLPCKWEDLTQEQLRYVYYAMDIFNDTEAKAFIFVRLTGINVIRKKDNGWICSINNGHHKIRFILENYQVASAIKHLKWIEKPASYPVCLIKIGKFHSIDNMFHGLSFMDYLIIENSYQGYLSTKDEEHLRRMGSLMYEDKKGNHPDGGVFQREELLSVFAWYAALKLIFARQFNHLFKGAADNTGNENVEDLMNAEIRALTGGDITKEEAIFEIDCWRALTELNEKAREADELERKYRR